MVLWTDLAIANAWSAGRPEASSSWKFFSTAALLLDWIKGMLTSHVNVMLWVAFEQGAVHSQAACVRAGVGYAQDVLARQQEPL